MVGLGDLPGGETTSSAYDVSGDGSIVVGDSNAGSPDDDSPTAFIWDSGNGIRNLKDVLETDYGLDLTDWQLQRATGISDDGNTIVGTGINPDGVEEGWLFAVNELPVPVPMLSPPGVAMLGGLLMLGAIGRLRTNATPT